MDELQKGEILIYQIENGETKMDVFPEDGTARLSQASIANLWQTTPEIGNTKNPPIIIDRHMFWCYNNHTK